MGTLMRHADFVHLHVHTNYSLLDGACRIGPLTKRAAELRFPALAMTDHGNIFGAVEFYETCMKGGIKPIIGVEAYIAPRSRLDKTGSGIRESSAHLVLLARDERGYANLMRLVSIGYLEGFYYRPRIDKEVLAQHREGLIALTSCLKGVLNVHLTQGQTELARKELDDLVQVLGREHVYVELQHHGLPLEERVRPLLIRLAQDAGVRCVATNDVHYLEQGHAAAHDALMAIQTQTTVDDPHRLRYERPEFYLKSAEEMQALFPDCPEAILATREIAERCNLELEFGRIHLPYYEPPPGTTQEAHLRALSLRGLTGRYPEVTQPLTERLEHELAVIKQAGYTSYFLIVWDFVRFAKERGIPVGPGRGSAAGSLVSYCLGVTDIDPLKYDLLFERFLNPQRVTQPDIDIDFCYERRGEVIDYVIQKYGKTHVAQIITFGTLQAKAVVRDVGRVLKMSYADVDRLAKLIPNDLDTTLTRALAEVPELAQLYRSNDQVRRLIETALILEGLTRHASTHAAGIVIADKPLTEYAPLFRSNDGQITTGFDMAALERIGLLKIDLLGLRTLTVIDEAFKLAERTRGAVINSHALPLDDPQAYQLLARAETMGVFQLESSGMRDLLRKIRPSVFEDIISVIALFRPGPIGSGMLDEFMKRKHGLVPIRYEHPRLEPILKATYGIIVYQEQVMRIASDLAGFSLAQADLLRRAMGKKNPEVMVAQRKAFIDGCRANKIPERQANRTFDLMEHFAGYGFNKCLTGDAELLDAETGLPVTIDALHRYPRPMTVCSLDDAHRIVRRRVLDVVANGRKPVFTITTRLGHSITVTSNHPLLTASGWQELRDLRVSDLVAVPRSLRAVNAQGRTAVEPYRLVTLAAVLSAGHTRHPSGVSVSNHDPSFIQDVVAHVTQFERTVPTVRRRGRGYEVYAGIARQTRFVHAQTAWNKGLAGSPRSGPPGSFPHQPRSGVREWIEGLGLAWVNPTEKSIPQFVFTLGEEQLALFLGRLWSGGGHVWTQAGPSSPCYTTASKRLARQVQHLLLRLGIVSRVRWNRFPSRGAVQPRYRVLVTGKEQRVRFANSLGPHMMGCDHALQALRSHDESVGDAGSNEDVLPSSMVIPLVRKIKERLGVTWDSLERHSGVSLHACSRSSHPPDGLRRATIRTLAEYLESTELLSLATSDIYWDRIASIESAGEQDTYDLEVAETHNFLANGLLVHNSHSAAYAMISYQTAYLKSHYPVEFMTALLTTEMGNTDKLVVYLEEAKRMGLTILPPDINASEAQLTVVDARTIRCGLGVIKNVGLGAIESILAARRSRGAYRGIEDLCQRIDVRAVNRKVLESLIKAGACDSMGVPRALLLVTLDQALEEATSLHRDRLRGQMTLFEGAEAFGTRPGPETGTRIGRLRDWPESQKLAFEKELLGFYVSGHPLARYVRLIKALGTATSARAAQAEDASLVSVGGMLTKIKHTTTKKTNEPMAVCLLEDLEGELEMLVFPGMFSQLAPNLKLNQVVVVEGRIAMREDRPRLIAQQIVPIDQASSTLVRSVELAIRTTAGDVLDRLKQLLARFPGTVPIVLRVELAEQPAARLRLAEDFRVNVQQELLQELDRLFGEEAVVIKRQPMKALASPEGLPPWRRQVPMST